MAQAFAATHGVEVADIIMEHLPPEGWSELVTKTDVATQGLLLRSDLESQISGLRDEPRGEMSKLGNELKADLADGFVQQLKWLVGTTVALFTVVSGLISVLVVVAK